MSTMTVPFRQFWNHKKPTVSFEFFPARTEKAEVKLQEVLPRLFSLKPDFVSVTFGAAGSSAEGSLRLLRQFIGMKSCAVVGYIAAYGLSAQRLGAIANEYAQAGADSIFCIRGDQPQEGDGTQISPHPEGFTYASEFVDYLKPRCALPIGVAGYPEGHRDTPDKQQDCYFLKRKVDAGAAYIITQYFYENDYFFDFTRRCRSIGITVPIIAGVMPIYSVKMTQSLSALCATSIPSSISVDLAAMNPDDKGAIEEYGVNAAVKQCKELLQTGVDGLHFYTMDRSQSVERIIKQLRLEHMLSETQV
ncbi:MAG: methylenetetrahydrofolate reductase [Chitinivibrionales bacterium]|nr:methylenetetrahydrofolate reductase [Chitinivibrionales bacterium]